MKKLVSRFAKDESGATAIEYGLIAAGIGVWDVLERSQRLGSLDADIDMASAKVNDFSRFFCAYPEIDRVSAMTYGDAFDVEEEARLTAFTREGTTLTLTTSWRFTTRRHAPTFR